MNHWPYHQLFSTPFFALYSHGSNSFSTGNQFLLFAASPQVLLSFFLLAISFFFITSLNCVFTQCAAAVQQLQQQQRPNLGALNHKKIWFDDVVSGGEWAASTITSTSSSSATSTSSVVQAVPCRRPLIRFIGALFLLCLCRGSPLLSSIFGVTRALLFSPKWKKAAAAALLVSHFQTRRLLNFGVFNCEQCAPSTHTWIADWLIDWLADRSNGAPLYLIKSWAELNWTYFAARLSSSLFSDFDWLVVGHTW